MLRCSLCLPLRWLGAWALLLVMSGVVCAAGLALRLPADGAAGVILPVTLRWSGDPAADGYECAVARDAAFTNSALLDGAVPGTSLTLSHLLPGTQYFWRVRAMAGDTPGEWSAVRSFTTSEEVPIAARDGRMVFGGAGICIMNADGSGVTRLAPSGNSPVISPDGRQIAFINVTGDWQYQLFLMDADGSNMRVIAKADFDNERIRMPVFTADGSRLLYVRQLEGRPNEASIWLVNRDGTEKQEIPNTEAENILSLTLTTDGERVVWNNFGQQMRVNSIKLDGTEKRLLLDRYTSDLQVMQDGAILAADGLLRMDADGTHIRRITDQRDGHLAISPDGKQLACVFSDSVDHEHKLCVMNIDGTERRVLYTQPWNATGSITDPAWGPEP